MAITASVTISSTTVTPSTALRTWLFTTMVLATVLVRERAQCSVVMAGRPFKSHVFLGHRTGGSGQETDGAKRLYAVNRGRVAGLLKPFTDAAKNSRGVEPVRGYNRSH